MQLRPSSLICRLLWEYERKSFASIRNMLKEDNLVRMKGLEPPRLSAPDPKSGAATNYATSASKATRR